MIAVNLDDIIHYRPPAPKHHRKPLQALSLVTHRPSPLASDTFLQTHQVPPCLTPPIFPSSAHSPSLQDHAQNLQSLASGSTGETQYLPLFNSGLPKQSTIEGPNGFDKELLNSATVRNDGLVMSDMYSMDREAQNSSVGGNGGQESHNGPCNDGS